MANANFNNYRELAADDDSTESLGDTQEGDSERVLFHGTGVPIDETGRKQQKEISIETISEKPKKKSLGFLSEIRDLFKELKTEIKTELAEIKANFDTRFRGFEEHLDRKLQESREEMMVIVSTQATDIYKQIDQSYKNSEDQFQVIEYVEEQIIYESNQQSNGQIIDCQEELQFLDVQTTELPVEIDNFEQNENSLSHASVDNFHQYDQPKIHCVSNPTHKEYAVQIENSCQLVDGTTNAISSTSSVHTFPSGCVRNEIEYIHCCFCHAMRNVISHSFSFCTFKYQSIAWSFQIYLPTLNLCIIFSPRLREKKPTVKIKM